MRYLNWDILIFPDEHKIPIQEYDTKCHALPASNDRPLSQELINAAGSDYHSSVTQTLTLTCFIESLHPHTAFRVSVHSWEKPKVSPLLLSFKPSEHQVAFEAKLYVDGKLKCMKWMKHNNTWPEVLDEASMPENEFAKPLLFPPFHPEILKQSHWDPNDKLGRIRLVLAEGVGRFDQNGRIFSFNRLRDVVVFSFQHSPRELLEYAGIAWPNARMFQKTADPKPQLDFQAHAHSPQGSIKHNTQQQTTALNGSHPSTSWSGSQARTLSPDDPFIGPSMSFFGRRQQTSSGDISMLDYSASKRGSEMSGVSIAKPAFLEQVNRANIDELVQALTPSKRAALLDALSPPERNNLGAVGTAQSNRIISIKSLDKLTPRPGSAKDNVRKASSTSRSTSGGNSTVMSWDESPTLGDLWAHNHRDFPGILPTLQTSTRSKRSDSAGSKRKRSLSPPQLLQSSTDNLTGNVRGMSTSPCKKPPTAKKGQNPFAKAAEVESGSEDESDAN